MIPIRKKLSRVETTPIRIAKNGKVGGICQRIRNFTFFFRDALFTSKLIQYFVAREQQQDTFYPFVEVVFEVNPYDTIAATIIIIIIIIITPLFPIEIFVCFYFLGEGSLSALPCTSSP